MLATAVAYVAALVSWNLFEKRLLALKRFFPTERGPRSQPAPATG